MLSWCVAAWSARTCANFPQRHPTGLGSSTKRNMTGAIFGVVRPQRCAFSVPEPLTRRWIWADLQPGTIPKEFRIHRSRLPASPVSCGSLVRPPAAAGQCDFKPAFWAERRFSGADMRAISFTRSAAPGQGLITAPKLARA